MKHTYTEEQIQDRHEQAETLSACRQAKRHKNATSFHTVCLDVIENGARRYKGRLIDHFSASAFMAVYKALNAENQTKLDLIGTENPLKAMNIVWKLIK